MGRILLAVLVAVVAGCGSRPGIVDEVTPPNPEALALMGTWAIAERQCQTTITFGVGGTYEIDLTCKAPTGAPTGQQVELGTYDVRNGQLLFTASESTCSPATKDYARTLTVLETGQITIGTDGNVKTFTRVDHAAAAMQTLGCWGTSGAKFTAGPLSPL